MVDNKKANPSKAAEILAEGQRARRERDDSYRGRALKIFPWVCGSCGRDFEGKNLSELTVHHKDHDHNNNPPDGSNWELLCYWCHDNEHSRHAVAEASRPGSRAAKRASDLQSPFANLDKLLKDDK
jgi:5-methylcytosine-specific restriction endonuclease McrA